MTCVDILYIGRPSELLLVTSEQMVVTDAVPTLQHVLCRLRAHDARWAYELDERHVICTVNRASAVLSDARKKGTGSASTPASPSSKGDASHRGG